jgi:DNA-binding beta-propeller fold protein YncE
VREAVLKYDVKHPVINDEEMIFWDSLERRSWPSLAILSPEGCPLLFLSGEGHRDRLELFLDVAIDFYGDRLDRTPVEIYLEEEKEVQSKENKFNRLDSLTREDKAALKSNLRFPSKIICIANQPCLPYDCNILVLSDTGNNRVLVINLATNECLDSIGSGSIGLVDGDYNDCSFHHPQGLCHVYRENEHFVYICDSNNHAIREINLNKREVLTVIGTGEQGRDREGNKNPEIQQLSSPWDVVAINRDTLIIAIAGTHQIWALNLKNNR